MLAVGEEVTKERRPFFMSLAPVSGTMEKGLCTCVNCVEPLASVVGYLPSYGSAPGSSGDPAS